MLRALRAVLIINFLIMCPFLSYADWNGHDNGGTHEGSGHSNNYSHHDRSYVGVNLGVWPDNYYYGAPYYPAGDEVLVSPPAFEPVVINGTTYYLNDGAYYIYTGYGYQPVTPPSPAVIAPPPVVDNQGPSAAPVIITPGTADNAPDSITINIPNNKGGYTAVTLKRSGNGFIGPQGEFYPEFPTVTKLEVIYGK